MKPKTKTKTSYPLIGINSPIPKFKMKTKTHNCQHKNDFFDCDCFINGKIEAKQEAEAKVMKKISMYIGKNCDCDTCRLLKDIKYELSQEVFGGKDE